MPRPHESQTNRDVVCRGSRRTSMWVKAAEGSPGCVESETQGPPCMFSTRRGTPPRSSSARSIIVLNRDRCPPTAENVTVTIVHLETSTCPLCNACLSCFDEPPLSYYPLAFLVPSSRGYCCHAKRSMYLDKRLLVPFGNIVYARMVQGYGCSPSGYPQSNLPG